MSLATRENVAPASAMEHAQRGLVHVDPDDAPASASSLTLQVVVPLPEIYRLERVFGVTLGHQKPARFLDLISGPCPPPPPCRGHFSWPAGTEKRAEGAGRRKRRRRGGVVQKFADIRKGRLV